MLLPDPLPTTVNGGSQHTTGQERKGDSTDVISEERITEVMSSRLVRQYWACCLVALDVQLDDFRDTDFENDSYEQIISSIWIFKLISVF